MAYKLDDKVAYNAHNLAVSLQNSKEYLEFESAKNALESDCISLQSFMQIREEQLQMYMSRLLGDEDEAQKNRTIDEISTLISGNKLINDYVNAEYRLHKMIQKVQAIFNDSLNFSFDNFTNDDELLN